MKNLQFNPYKCEAGRVRSKNSKPFLASPRLVVRGKNLTPSSPQHFYGEGKIYVGRSGERWVKQDGAKLSSLTMGYYREESYGSGLKTLVKGFKSKIS